MTNQPERFAERGKYTGRLTGHPNPSFTRIKQKPDGNCLFRSVAYHTLDDAERHAEIRRRVCDHFQANRAEYENVIAALVPDSMTDFPNTSATRFDAYIRHMRTPCRDGDGGVRKWGGDPEIRAVEQLYQRRVEVYESINGDLTLTRTDVGDQPFPESEPIRLVYSGSNHYDALDKK